ncbi:calcium-binding protein [Kitasatospora sp. NPDC002227]|uniref:calcium-binding protein n=1 Tax=Kitasatospora sp. NPDC002227 TaxID=3154773 RepID=UPI003320683E
MRKRAVVLGVALAAAASAVLLVPTVATETSRGDTVVDAVTVNDGRTVLLGPAERVTFPVVVTASDDSGIAGIDPIGVWGPTYGVLKVSPMSCDARSATTSVCRGTVTVDPVKKDIFNDEVGTWFVDLKVRAKDGDRYLNQTAGGFSIKRAARMTGSGVPRGAAVGQELAVEGWLARAFYSDNRYHGYADGTAYLQFRPRGGTLWTTVATAASDLSGVVRAKTTVTGPGDYQWYSPGDKWTGDAVSPELPVG